MFVLYELRLVASSPCPRYLCLRCASPLGMPYGAWGWLYVAFLPSVRTSFNHSEVYPQFSSLALEFTLSLSPSVAYLTYSRGVCAFLLWSLPPGTSHSAHSRGPGESCSPDSQQGNVSSLALEFTQSLSPGTTNLVCNRGV